MKKILNASVSRRGVLAGSLAGAGMLAMPSILRAQDKSLKIGVYGGYPAPFDNAAMAELGGENQPIGMMCVRVLVDGWEPEKAIDEADKFAKDTFAKYFK